MEEPFSEPPTVADVHAIARQALDGLPHSLRRHLCDVVILIEEFPDPEIEIKVGLDSPFDLLGLYQGTSLDQKSVSAVPDDVDRIFLYRRPLLDYWCETGEDFEAIIRNTLIQDVAQRLLTVPGEVGSAVTMPPGIPDTLDATVQRGQKEIQRDISERNAKFFAAEVDKLDNWADDLKLGLEREIKEIDRQIREARRAATTALTLEEKLAGQKQIKALESLRNQKRRTLFDAQDEVDKQRAELIARIEGKLAQNTSCQTLFSIRWALV